MTGGGIPVTKHATNPSKRVPIEFRTGFVVLPGEDENGSLAGAGWTARLKATKSATSVGGGREIVLSAHSWPAAQRAVDLINGSRQLMNGSPDRFPYQPIAHNGSQPAWMDGADRAALADRQRMTQTGLRMACAIAAKASRRRKWSYGIAQYKFSLGLYSVHPMDMHPTYRTYHGVSGHPDDHVLLAHTLVAAFDAIEELGLSVPAGRERPSRVRGAWNPVVLADLEGRLKRQGIDPSETVLWSVRGPVRRIETQRPIPTGSLPSWAGGSVRDRRMPVADAIGYSDYLRDRVAAHSTRALTRSLTPYDVVNVQGLARFLLLASLGFRVWQRNP